MPTEAPKLSYVEFLQALRNGSEVDRVSLLKSAIAKAGLSPEQEALVDLLFTSSDTREGSTGDDGPSDSGRPVMSKPIDASFCDEGKAADLQEELASLREANDTLAAALGACQYCWGGNRECGACEGQGRPGRFSPNMPLFRELIWPAVKKALAVRRQSGRTSATRPGRFGRPHRPGNAR